MTIHEYERFRYRASYPVYLAFGLNKSECWTLFQLSGYLKACAREVVSRKLFLESLSGNHRMKVKTLGFYYGLIDKGMLGTYEYISRPGSLCVGITDLGYKALEMYERELERLRAKQKTPPKIKHGLQNYRPIKDLSYSQQNNLLKAPKTLHAGRK